MMNALFVCSRNQWRSPTAERIWMREPGVSVRSAGTSRSARRRVTVADISWAELIFPMEEAHKARLLADFRNEMRGKSVHVLDIADDYGFMHRDLIELIADATRPIIERAMALDQSSDR